MPGVLEDRRYRVGGVGSPAPSPPERRAASERTLALPGRPAPSERRARDDLRAQIATLERRLSETFAAAFPRRDIEWRVGAVGGPRLLSIGELERVRDALVYRLNQAEAEIGRRVERERASRGLLDEMIAAPERHRWVRISNEHIGEPGCRHWHSRPRWGLLGMVLNWWRVKVSSGCPLAAAGRPRLRPRPRPSRPDRRSAGGE